MVCRERLFSRKWRIALYSPGMVGLGHMRRNLLIAETLARFTPSSAILLIAEAREANAFSLPRGVDCLTLPALRKELDGRNQPRYLDIPSMELTELRANVIRSALETFEPELLIVDHLPLGAFRELAGTLESLHASGRTRFVLGMRDVLEDYATVQREWFTPENRHALHHYYNRIWVYGDPFVFDLVREYGFSESLAAKIRYCGYLDPRVRLNHPEVEYHEFYSELGLPHGALMLCLVGGGQDGSRLAQAFVQAKLPKGSNGVLVTGPYMPLEERGNLRLLASDRARLRILQFVSEPALLMNSAHRVIAMGGYNTVCEVLSFEKPALIVPRATSRPEQWIRATRLQELGLIDVLHPDEVNAASLSDWMNGNDRRHKRAKKVIDFRGLKRLADLLEEVLALPYQGASFAVQLGGNS